MIQPENRKRPSTFGMYLFACVMIGSGSAVVIATDRWGAFWLAFGVSIGCALIALAADNP